MNELIPFKFENRNVRVVMLDGVEWWVARDVALALAYKNYTDAITRHCKGVVNHYPLQTAGGKQDVRILSEGDVWRLITHSNLPEAQRFEKWLFEVVLPRIRRGGYITGERFEALEAKVAELSEEKKLREENERLRRSKTRPTPQEEREIWELRRQGYSKAQIQRELFRGIRSINRILEKYEDAMGQLGLFDNEAVEKGETEYGAD
ncbi:MAG: hypothetical protein LBG76_03665 [Treponema sp.]|nr:hypothetical protein [Treponema sp.]